MGSEMTGRTRKVLLESVKADVTRTLDKSIEQQKTPEPFLARLHRRDFGQQGLVHGAVAVVGTHGGRQRGLMV